MRSAVEREYRTLSPLDVRIQTHRRYSEAAHDVEADVIAAAAVTSGDRLLDVGPGTGTFLARLAADHTAPLTALDFSAESAAACAALPGVRALRGDAHHLPFAAGSFDVVTARHMLYHLDDPVPAVAEAGRVLRPGGRFAAVVNRRAPYPRMTALLNDVLTRHDVVSPPSPDERVHGGNLPGIVAEGLGLGPDSDRITILRRDDALVFPDAAPVVAYLVSILTLHGVPDDSPLRAPVTAALDAAVRAAFRTLPGGVWRDPKGYVIVTASP
ncbi:MAG: class I SAM-dependent methyltransferase [Catenulispora sp.]|nr:class I SAM-dependent methyltransferase [Catenulispora sp.]